MNQQLFRHARSPALILLLLVSSLLACILIWGYFACAGAVLEPSLLKNFGDVKLVEFLKEINAITNSCCCLQGLLLVITSVMFLIWIRQTIQNCNVLVGDLKTKLSDSVVVFLIPFLNLFRPQAVLNEIYKASYPTCDRSSWKTSKASKLILVWWCVWLICCAAFCFTIWAGLGLKIMNSITPKVYAFVFQWAAVTEFLMLANNFLTIAVVARVNKMQSVKFSKLTATELPSRKDLVSRLGSLISVLVKLGYLVSALASIEMIGQFVAVNFGWGWIFVCVIIGPLAAFVVPFYAALVKGDWSIVFVLYGVGITLTMLAHLAEAFAEPTNLQPFSESGSVRDIQNAKQSN